MLRLVIASPEQSFFSGPVKSVILPGTMGEFEILNNHAPLMSLLQTGSVIAYPTDGEPVAFCIDSGMAQVIDNEVSILVDTAFKARLHEQQKLITQQNEYRKQLDQQGTVDYTVLLKELSQLSSELYAINRIQKHRKK